MGTPHHQPPKVRPIYSLKSPTAATAYTSPLRKGYPLNKAKPTQGHPKPAPPAKSQAINALRHNFCIPLRHWAGSYVAAQSLAGPCKKSRHNPFIPAIFYITCSYSTSATSRRRRTISTLCKILPIFCGRGWLGVALTLMGVGFALFSG